MNGQRSPPKWDGAWKMAGGGKGARPKVTGKNTKDLEKVWQEKSDSEQEKCSRCKLRVGTDDMGLACDGCEHWFHRTCEKVPEDEYEMINKVGENVKWYCGGCEGVVQKLKIENRKLKEENSNLVLENKELRSELQYLKERIEKIEKTTSDWNKTMEKEILSLKKELGDKMKKVFEETMIKCEEKIESGISKIKDSRLMKPIDNDKIKHELENMKEEIISRGVEEVRKHKGNDETQLQNMQQKIEEIEKEKRFKNLIFFNLKESNKDQPLNRFKEDEVKCRDIIVNELGLENMETIGLENLIRLGKKNERNRPLLVKLRSEEEVRMILRVASRMRHSQKYEKVYISRDLSQDERKKEKELREELKEKRSRNSGRYTIRKGKIVKVSEADLLEVEKNAS